MCLKMPSTDIQSLLDDLTSKLIVLADNFAVILGVIPAFTNRYTGRAIRGALQGAVVRFHDLLWRSVLW